MGPPKKSDLDFILNPSSSKKKKKSSPGGGSDSDSEKGGRSYQGTPGAGPSRGFSQESSSDSPPRDGSGASEKPFECDECHKRFKERGNLNKHISSVHEKKKSHVCHLCGKSFAFRDGLVRHISHVHQNERRYTCEVCNRQFKQLSHLAKHKKTIHKIE